MNTGRQINAMVALVFLVVLLTGAYALVDPIRAERQEDYQVEQSVERGAKLFANNCRSCHANNGRGVLEDPAQYPGAPLNAEQYRDPTALEETQDRLFQTIACGRFGTLMPPWSQEHGGPLNDQQIRQLVLLITTEAGIEGWEKAEELGNQLDEEFGVVPAPDASNPDNLTKGTCGAPASVPQPGGGQQPPAAGGQTPPAGETPSAGAGAQTEWEVVATDNAFDLSTITAPAGQQVTVKLTNEGQQPHNISFYEEQNGPEIHKGEIVMGGEETTEEFTSPSEPGSYWFQCDVHPNQMTGTFEVVG